MRKRLIPRRTARPERRSDAPALTERETTAGICWFPVYAAGLPLLGSLAGGLEGGWRSLLLSAVGCAVTSVIFRRFLAASFRRLTEDAGRAICAILVGAAVYWAALFALSVAAAALGVTEETDGRFFAGSASGDIRAAVSAVIFAPVTEEALFRALLFGGLAKKNRPAAYIVSTLVFGVMHLWPHIGSLGAAEMAVSLILYVPGGLILARVYERTETVWASVLLHALINLTGCLFSAIL